MMKKVQITIDEVLLERMDEYAQKNFLTRSGLISLLGTQMLQEAELINKIMDISQCFRKIADTSEIDDENLKRLEELETYCRLVNNEIKLRGKFKGGF